MKSVHYSEINPYDLNDVQKVIGGKVRIIGLPKRRKTKKKKSKRKGA